MDISQILRALTYASIKHRDQRRKDAEASPYINHPIAVAAVLAAEGAVTSEVILIAAILHDTVEDTQTTFEELTHQFGAAVSEIVRELTDDKSLPSTVRKQLQIEHARTASIEAKQVKIADKICNLRDIAVRSPVAWSTKRRREYLSWAKQVVDGCRGVNPNLDATFDAALALAQQSIANVD